MLTINDKIKQILIDKNLTPSYFADEIGVQRSSISHILSGRNRPSFDIIQKIIRRFPELGYEWIMEEEGQNSNQTIPAGVGYGTNRSVGRPPSIERADRFTNSGTLSYQPQSPGVRSQRTEIPPVSLPVQPETTSSVDAQPSGNSSADKPEKKVERILIFYTDGSFREYTPTA
ncbi:helix-turn-helix transcriptional regulator [Spirosoma fluviale]|uniref:DNA-binding transcriptional regulator, XRE-family HTH domain n=1 Tax=Spirosoma fluviale TaxID=1597977 RepID=A0A286FFC8_9BACT|nr:helix-turn-helix transcriptional regulator [Spirosoma fluviale]SOD81955.1 DNA-binding transcriptional regulator, XRE-family HTH domain [Spirosoma fluviale]